MKEKAKGPDAQSELYLALARLSSEEDVYRFLCDLCTVSELKAMEQRFRVAGLLDRDHIYTEIVEETGASSATISRVNRCLNYGDGGYRAALDCLSPEEGERSRS